VDLEETTRQEITTTTSSEQEEKNPLSMEISEPTLPEYAEHNLDSPLSRREDGRTLDMELMVAKFMQFKPDSPK
jgi:hypothetical protein